MACWSPPSANSSATSQRSKRTSISLSASAVSAASSDSRTFSVVALSVNTVSRVTRSSYFVDRSCGSGSLHLERQQPLEGFRPVAGLDEVVPPDVEAVVGDNDAGRGGVVGVVEPVGELGHVLTVGDHGDEEVVVGRAAERFLHLQPLHAYALGPAPAGDNGRQGMDVH